MLTSIVIPSWNLSDKLDKCLQALRQHTERNKYQLIIIDNGSTEDIYDVFKRYSLSTDIYIRLGKNHGYAKASNLGADAADGELLLFMNNDVYVAEEEWLSEMVMKIIEGNTIVGHKLLYPDDTIQHAGVGFTTDGRAYNIQEGKAGDVSGSKQFLAVTFACAMMSKADFIRLQGLDERYINGFEDIDLCLRVALVNGKTICCLDKKIYHDEGSTPGRHLHEMKNVNMFLSKWKVPLFGLIDRER